MKEAELAEHFIKYLSDFDIYKEVPCAGIIDIVAVSGRIITAVEVKCSLNFEVIEQAVKNKSYAHYSYIAVPYPKHKSYAFQICKEVGIGVLCHLPSQENNVKEIIKPLFNRRILAPELKDWMKESVAGSQNDRMTAFKNTVREIERTLIRKGGKAHITEVLKETNHHYASITSAKACIIDMIHRGVIKGFTNEKGILIINKNETN